MYYGIDLPTAGEFANARVLAALAHDAEAAGWDGFFVYDQVAAEDAEPLADPWISLTAVALATTHLRFGPLVTPLPRRRPWKVARETVTLDQLSGGRLILGVGIGVAHEEFDDLGEERDLRTRAAMLDEALDVLVGLWRGQPFSYAGAHYRLHEAHFLPPPIQSPRIPIWTGGTWPLRAPFRRAARWDGMFPHYRAENGRIEPMPAEALADAIDYVRSIRGPEPFDVVLRGATPGDDPRRANKMLQAYAEAGLTWWLEGIEGGRDLDQVHTRIRQGPPRCEHATSVP